MTTTVGRRSMRPWAGRLVTLPTIEPTLQAALAIPSSCVPGGSVILSYTNHHHLQLRSLQFERLKHLQCFMTKVVSVCYGEGDSFGICIPAPVVPPSVFRRGAYIELLWAKWRLVHAALNVAKTVLFLDSDVVLLRNPFEVVREPWSHDIRFQTSLACSARTCAETPKHEGLQVHGAPPIMRPCQLNGGVFFVSNQKLVDRVLDWEPALIGSRDINAVNHADIDQDLADIVVRSGNFSFCPLPAGQFVGHCFNRQLEPRGNRSFFEGLAPCQIATYHTTCIASAAQKGLAMQRMLNRTAHCNQPGAYWGGRLGVWQPSSQRAKQPVATHNGPRVGWRRGGRAQKHHGGTGSLK